MHYLFVLREDTSVRKYRISIASVSKLINDYAQSLDESGAWQRERELWNYNPVTIDETASEAAKYMTEWYANGWRMPTRDELTELAEKCEWQWVANADSTGYRVTGPNGNSIFLPTTGICSGRRHLLAGAEGYYWSSDAITYLLDVAFALRFTPRIINHVNYKETPRSNGCAVRAVHETAPSR